MTTFAKTLTKLMANANVSVKQAAAIAEVPPSTVSSWKNGVAPTQFVAVKRLASHFNVSLSYLLTGERDTPSSEVPEIDEVFSEGDDVYNGYAQIIIKRLIPKKKIKPSE